MRFLLLALILLPTGLLASSAEEELKRFLNVFLTLNDSAADPLDSETAFYQGAIPGMLRQLDPHTVFFDPGQFSQLRRLQTSTEKGFGTVVNVLPGRVIVLQTLPGTPSARAGIEAGDEILAINGIPLSQLDTEQLIQVLGQARQQTAQIAVRRPGNARLLPFTLDPQEIDSPSIDRVFTLSEGVAYIRIKSFDSATGRQLKEAIDSLGGAALKGLVLDLRDNPGGMLSSALEACSLFLPPETEIFSVKGRSVEPTTEKVPKFAEPYMFPVSILVDGKSASASEILAGALQDHDRAWIVGTPTFGKGLVQRVYQLANETGLALTTSFYYIPSGRSIQRPLKDFNLTPDPLQDDKRTFTTKGGRVVEGGGGLRPDRIVYPEQMTPLRAFLDSSGAITSFATVFLREQRDIPEDFAVDALVLDRFQGFLSENNVRPSLAEWSREREWITHRLATEIITQKFGVDQGDRIAARRDPQIQTAVRLLETPVLSGK